jgi:hypothetical protein
LTLDPVDGEVDEAHIRARPLGGLPGGPVEAESVSGGDEEPSPIILGGCLGGEGEVVLLAVDLPPHDPRAGNSPVSTVSYREDLTLHRLAHQ